MDWHLITCEYPPQSGGVSDYSHLVASGLAATGETVHVWCSSGGAAQETNTDGVTVHRALGSIGLKDLRRVGRLLDKFPAPRQLLVQWVPHGYGYQSMNLLFCLWLWLRAKFKQDRIEIMVHEPFLAFGEGSAKQDLVAAVHRTMVVLLLLAARRVWVSTPDWEKRLRPFAFGRDRVFGWLPVPANIAVVDNPAGIKELRARYTPQGEFLLGHFGAYDHYMTKLMLEVVPSLLTRHEKLSILLLGKGSLELRNILIQEHPDLSRYIHATGIQSSRDLSRNISACQVMLQPYQDGVSGRRGSTMALLAHGRAVVTTVGNATESCWIESQAVKLVKAGDLNSLVAATRSLLADPQERCRLGNAAKALYDERFDVKRTITALREAVA